MDLISLDTKIWFPQQWEAHGCARIVVLVKEDLSIKEMKDPTIEDLQVIILEFGAMSEPQ